MDRSTVTRHIRSLREDPTAMSGRRVGVRVEWIVKRCAEAINLHSFNRAGPQSLSEVVPGLEWKRHAGTLLAGRPVALPGGGALGFGPGGQFRYISPLLADPVAVIHQIRLHVGGIVHRLQRLGMRCLFEGLDPVHEPSEIPLQLSHLRQRLMDAWFEEKGPDGLHAMRCTAALHITFGIGQDEDDGATLERAEKVAPLLAAIFANSPGTLPGGQRVQSRRLLHILDTDAARTGAVGFREGQDPARTFAAYALGARVILRDDGHGGPAALEGSPRLEDWLGKNHPQGPPSERDLGTHLSTLFPPVNLGPSAALTCLDTQHPRWLPVPILVFETLMHTAGGRKLADDLPRIDLREAATLGIRGPGLAKISSKLLGATHGLMRDRQPDSLSALVRSFLSHFTARGRMPADDVQDSRHEEHPAATNEAEETS